MTTYAHILLYSLHAHLPIISHVSSSYRIICLFVVYLLTLSLSTYMVMTYMCK